MFKSVNDALLFLTEIDKLPLKEQNKHVQDIIAASVCIVNETDSLIPVLGSMIHVRQKPFTDGMFPQFHPLFNLSLTPRSILKTARQVGKSSSFAAKTIMLSAMIPFFQTLTVTPQYEMTRRFSSNYVRPLIEYSPIAPAMVDTKCEKSVLQKTFINQSMMHFSFAFLDADRVRGIPADRVHADECLIKLSTVTTYENTIKYIGHDLNVKDTILTFDKEGSIVTDTVTDVVCKGTRPTWKITLADGRTLSCTANELLYTDQGWTHLQEILDYAYEQYTGNKAPSRDWVSSGGYPRDALRGWSHELDAETGRIKSGSYLHDTRGDSSRVLSPQGRSITGLRTYPSEDSREQRLGEQKLCFYDSDLPGIRLLTGSVLQGGRQDQEGKKDCNQGMDRPVDSGELGVLLHGRRFDRQTANDCTTVGSQLQQTGGTASSEPPEEARNNGRATTGQPVSEQKRWVLHQHEQRCCTEVHRDGEATHSREYDIQDSDTRVDGVRRQGADVHVLPRGDTSEEPLGRSEQDDRVRQLRMSTQTALDTQSTLHQQIAQNEYKKAWRAKKKAENPKPIEMVSCSFCGDLIPRGHRRKDAPTIACSKSGCKKAKHRQNCRNSEARQKKATSLSQ